MALFHQSEATNNEEEKKTADLLGTRNLPPLETVRVDAIQDHPSFQTWHVLGVLCKGHDSSFEALTKLPSTSRG